MHGVGSIPTGNPEFRISGWGRSTSTRAPEGQEAHKWRDALLIEQVVWAFKGFLWTHVARSSSKRARTEGDVNKSKCGYSFATTPRSVGTY